MDTEFRNQPGQSSLLSEEYRRLNRELHEVDPQYGTTSRRYVAVVRSLAQKFAAQTLLDYGCGKRDLWHLLAGEFDVRNFDPAIPEFANRPEPADLVACIDVLEHVESDYLEIVLADLARVTIKVLFLTIATQPSGKILSNGANCHCTIQCATWWQKALDQRFRIIRFDPITSDNGVQAVVVPK